MRGWCLAGPAAVDNQVVQERARELRGTKSLAKLVPATYLIMPKPHPKHTLGQQFATHASSVAFPAQGQTLAASVQSSCRPTRSAQKSIGRQTERSGAANQERSCPVGRGAVGCCLKIARAVPRLRLPLPSSLGFFPGRVAENTAVACVQEMHTALLCAGLTHPVMGGWSDL